MTLKSKHVLKVLLDIALIAMCVALYVPFVTGLVLHELMGICAIAFIGLHLFLNRQWVYGILHKTKEPMTGKKRTSVFLNTILLAGFTLVAISGIFSAKVIFNWQSSPTIELLTRVHYYSAYVCLGILAAHVLLHAKYLCNMTKRIIQQLHVSNIRRVVTVFFSAASLMAILCLYIAPQLERNYMLKVSGELVMTGSNTQVSADDNKDSNKEENYTTTQIDGPNQTASEDIATLSDYLGGLFCSACGRHCSLLAPQCRKGVAQAEKATTQYEALYGDL